MISNVKKENKVFPECVAKLREANTSSVVRFLQKLEEVTMSHDPLIQVIEPRIPHRVIYSYCKQTQLFRKKKEHWRTIKSPHLKRRVLFKVRMIYAKCRNPDCLHKSFALPIPGIERYQRATHPLMSEAVARVIQDNSTLERIAQRLSRSLNTTRSKSALDRWKKRLASQYDFPTIPNQLQFTGALSIDEYMPNRVGNEMHRKRIGTKRSAKITKGGGCKTAVSLTHGMLFSLDGCLSNG